LGQGGGPGVINPRAQANGFKRGEKVRLPRAVKNNSATVHGQGARAANSTATTKPASISRMIAAAPSEVIGESAIGDYQRPCSRVVEAPSVAAVASGVYVDCISAGTAVIGADST